MTYDLEHLGYSGFQDLAASLAVAVFGPDVEVMGAGRDGGRDMYLDGPLTWTEDQAESETWTGYTVFQVKSKDNLSVERTGDRERKDAPPARVHHQRRADASAGQWCGRHSGESRLDRRACSVPDARAIADELAAGSPTLRMFFRPSRPNLSKKMNRR